MRKPLSVNIHDSHLGIWQDDARDESLRSEVYGELIRRMRTRGWSIRRDPRIHQNFRCLSSGRRLGARGTLRCEIEIAGRTVKVEFWSTTAEPKNPNGRRYDFNKLQRMKKLDRLRVELEFRRIIAWLETIAPVKIERRDEQDLTPSQRIAKSYASSWHKNKDLGRPVCDSDYNRKSKDGALLEHGQTVWLPDRKGRLIRGVAYYNINNMWWVIAGGQLHNEGSHSLFAMRPMNIRTKLNDRARRSRLEEELRLAVQRMDFQRAHVLKTIIFGTEQTYMIWARDHQAYYRSQYAGYSSDTAGAGRYTRAEAEAECRRAPDQLEMICPDGTRIAFDRSAA